MDSNRFRFGVIPLFLPLLVMFVAFSAAGAPDSADQAAKLVPSHNDTISGLKPNTFVVETRHRLYPEFRQVDTVGLEDPFYIGEDDWEARIITFNPHLGITQTGERLVMSDTLYNPAIEVQVKAGDSVSQTSWGFYYVDSPHFYREDLLGFKLLDFKVGPEYIQPPDRK